MCVLDKQKQSLSCQAKRVYKYVTELSSFLEKLKPSVNVEDPKFKKAIEIMEKIDKSLLSDELVAIQESQSICGEQNFFSSKMIANNNNLIVAMQHHQEVLGQYGLSFDRVFKILREKETHLLSIYQKSLETCFTEDNLTKIKKLEEEIKKNPTKAAGEHGVDAKQREGKKQDKKKTVGSKFKNINGMWKKKKTFNF